jgi:hypothetical protein
MTDYDSTGHAVRIPGDPVTVRQRYWYNGRPVRPHPGLPHWHVVEPGPAGNDAALHIALFDAADGEVRAEVHWLRRDRDIAVAELWRRGNPESQLWRREYPPAAPGWHPYRDVLGEVTRVTGRPLPPGLREHVARVEAEETPASSMELYLDNPERTVEVVAIGPVGVGPVAWEARGNARDLASWLGNATQHDREMIAAAARELDPGACLRVSFPSAMTFLMDYHGGGYRAAVSAVGKPSPAAAPGPGPVADTTNVPRPATAVAAAGQPAHRRSFSARTRQQRIPRQVRGR